MIQVAQLVISWYPRPVQIIMIYFQLWSRYLYDSYFWYFHIGWKTMILNIIMRMNCLQFYRGPIVILLVSGSVGGDNINKRHFLHNYIEEFIQQFFSIISRLNDNSYEPQLTLSDEEFQDSDRRWICSPCVISDDLRKESLRNCTLAGFLARSLLI